MKNLKRVMLGLMAATVLFATSGCYGSFTVTKKVYKWNGKATDNKFANSIIMWAFAIIPVYSTCMFIDFVVLNTIEFWTGSNPLAMNEGESDMQIVQSGDKVFEVTATQNQFHIKQIEGENSGQAVDLKYKPNEAAWYVSDGEQEHMVAQGDLNNNDWVKIFHPDGKVEEIALN